MQHVCQFWHEIITSGIKNISKTKPHILGVFVFFFLTSFLHHFHSPTFLILMTMSVIFLPPFVWASKPDPFFFKSHHSSVAVTPNVLTRFSSSPLFHDAWGASSEIQLPANSTHHHCHQCLDCFSFFFSKSLFLYSCPHPTKSKLLCARQKKNVLQYKLFPHW